MLEGKPLPTIWDVLDDLWERIEPVILQLDPPKVRGRKRADRRKMLEGIIFRMCSGCQWNHLPRELETIAPSIGPSSAGGRWGAGGHLGCPDRRMPGVGRGGLGMAVGGLLHG